MNLLGKILTLLIMVMSLLFLFVAFMVAASHQNWKDQAEKNKRIADQRLADQRNIQAEIAKAQQQLQQERFQRQTLVAQLESQWQQARQLYESKEKELTQVQQDQLVKTNTLKEAEERLAELDKKIASLSQQITTLTQNIAAEHNKVMELQNLRYELDGKAKALERSRQQMADALAQANRVLKKNGLTPESLTDDIPPALTGVVAKVRDDLVEINLGTDDGLKNGHLIDIYRSGQFVGSAEVYNARNNQSVARVIPEMTNSAIQQNDFVTTEWSRPIPKNGQ